MLGRRYGSNRCWWRCSALAVARAAAAELVPGPGPRRHFPDRPEAGKVDGRPSSARFRSATPLDKKPCRDFAEIVSRPLFTPDRKPVQRDRPQAEEAARAVADMRLVGVMKSSASPRAR